MKLRSRYLNEDIEIQENIVTVNGRELILIPHNALEDIIYYDETCKAMEVRVEFHESASNTPDHYVWSCRISDSNGFAVEQIGEASPENLGNEIARQYPSLMAHKRAFDIAAITFLGFDRNKSIYSDQEIFAEGANNTMPPAQEAAETIAPVEAQPKSKEQELLDDCGCTVEPVQEEEKPKKQPAKSKKTPEEYASTYKLTFGKHKGEALMDVYRNDLQYCQYIVRVTDDTKLKALIEALMKSENGGDAVG